MLFVKDHMICWVWVLLISAELAAISTELAALLGTRVLYLHRADEMMRS